MLRNADWHLVTDVSGQPLGAVFKGREVQEEIQNFQIHGSDMRLFLLNTFLVAVFIVFAITNSAFLYNV
jgi:hypothetical protein